MYYNAPSVERQVRTGDNAKNLVLAYVNFYGETQGLTPQDLKPLADKLLVRYQPSASSTGNYALELQVTGWNGGELKPSWFHPENDSLLCFNEPSSLDVGSWLVVPCRELWQQYQTHPEQFPTRELKRTTQATQKARAKLLLVSVEFYRSQAITLNRTVSRIGLTDLF